MSDGFTVYLHITPSGKRYYGITSRPVKKRWNHGSGYVKNEYFYRAIQKYGWDNIQHEIVAEHLTKEQACALEKSLIKEYNTQDYHYGYNICAGGEHNYLPESSKKKISQANTGKKRTEEERAKMSVDRKGRPGPNKGKHLPDEWRENIRKGLTGKPHPHDKPPRDKVICEGIEFSGAGECASYYGVLESTMYQWLNGLCGAPDSFVVKGLTYKDKQTIWTKVINNSAKKVEYQGIVYDTVAAAAEAIGVESHTISRWLKGKYKMPDYIKKGNLHYIDCYRNIATY